MSATNDQMLWEGRALMTVEEANELAVCAGCPTTKFQEGPVAGHPIPEEDADPTFNYSIVSGSTEPGTFDKYLEGLQIFTDDEEDTDMSDLSFSGTEEEKEEYRHYNAEKKKRAEERHARRERGQTTTTAAQTQDDESVINFTQLGSQSSYRPPRHDPTSSDDEQEDNVEAIFNHERGRGRPRTGESGFKFLVRLKGKSGVEWVTEESYRGSMRLLKEYKEARPHIRWGKE